MKNKLYLRLIEQFHHDNFLLESKKNCFDESYRLRLQILAETYLEAKKIAETNLKVYLKIYGE